jgi:hypothetical protein
MKTKQKWHNRYIVGYSLILCPTLGLYGVYKSETIPSKWKKATYAALVFAIIGSIILYSV